MNFDTFAQTIHSGSVLSEVEEMRPQVATLGAFGLPIWHSLLATIGYQKKLAATS